MSAHICISGGEWQRVLAVDVASGRVRTPASGDHLATWPCVGGQVCLIVDDRWVPPSRAGAALRRLAAQTGGAL